MIINEESSLTNVNKELLLSYMQEKVLGELKLLDIFFKTTQRSVPMPFRSVSFLLLSSLTIVNEESSLTIVNGGLSLTIVFKKNENDPYILTMLEY